MGLEIGDGNFSGQMAASYSVEIVGVDRTRNELANLSRAIQSLRATKFSDKSTTSLSRNGSNDSLLVTKLDRLEGRVQTKAIAAMNAGVKAGRQAQVERLNAAITRYGIQRMAGKAGKNSGGGSAGRNKTTAMIKALKSNVEIKRNKNSTRITGWNGWPAGTPEYFAYQEKGTLGQNQVAKTSLGTAERRAEKNASKGRGRGIEAANSVGSGIVVAREEIKRGLGELR